MSGVSSWLQKMKKADLIDLCEEVGFSDYEGLRKTDIEIGLDEYLSQNASQFNDDKRFAPFYKTRTRGSPMKKTMSVTSLTSDIETTAKSIQRRVTRAAEELLATDDSEAEQATTRSRALRTPRASALSFASNVPLPPSPAVVADAIDRNTQVIRTKVAQAYEESGVVEMAQATRESLSTVVAVQFLITAFEAFNLRKEVLPDRFAFTIPAIAFIRREPYDVWLPDLFQLLTTSFWGPVTLWAMTSLFIPLAAAYFFNLTAKPTKSRSHAPHFAYTYDPLTFNIAKALLTFVIYGQDMTFGGWVDLEYVARINAAQFGGYKGVLVDTGVGALVSVYDAIIKK